MPKFDQGPAPPRRADGAEGLAERRAHPCRYDQARRDRRQHVPKMGDCELIGPDQAGRVPQEPEQRAPNHQDDGRDQQCGQEQHRGTRNQRPSLQGPPALEPARHESHYEGGDPPGEDTPRRDRREQPRQERDEAHGDFSPVLPPPPRRLRRCRLSACRQSLKP